MAITEMNQQYIATAEAALTKADPILGKLIASQKLTPRVPKPDYYASLCGSIIGQQVSVAAARAILDRFTNATDLDPRTALNLDDETIKAVGLSRQKISYIKDLSQHFVDDPAVYNHLDSQDDATVIAELTNVKGIGVWTAQMFLMFTLARPDVFAPADAGLQRAMVNLYGWKSVPSATELEATASKWRPHRTIASWHLWQSLNNTPT